MRPYLLIYRAILVNVIEFALLAIAAVKGWIAELLAADVTDLVIVIFVVFLVGLAICAKKIVTTAATPTGCSARRRTCPARPVFIWTSKMPIVHRGRVAKVAPNGRQMVVKSVGRSADLVLAGLPGGP